MRKSPRPLAFRRVPWSHGSTAPARSCGNGSEPTGRDAPGDSATEVPMDCEYRTRLSAFHDGELCGRAAREVRLHLVTCAWCAAELSEIREVSRSFGRLAAERVPPGLFRRGHEAAEAAARGASSGSNSGSRSRVLRVAGVLTGL